MRLVNRIYNKTIRNHLPRKYGIYNGIVTPSIRFLDIQENWPNHKKTNVEEIKEYVEPDDLVVEIGSGFGVCTVWSARQATSGRVIAFEASREMAKLTSDAVAVNSKILDDDLSERIEIRHAVIGDDVDVWGSAQGAEYVAPTELPECDVLITDCEGAEESIIHEMTIRPRVVIVEGHPNKGANVDRIRADLESRGYSVTARDDDVDSPHVVIYTAVLDT